MVNALFCLSDTTSGLNLLSRHVCKTTTQEEETLVSSHLGVCLFCRALVRRTSEVYGPRPEHFPA